MEDNVIHFSELTSASPEEAKQFLEASGNNLETAIAAYFDTLTKSPAQPPQASSSSSSSSNYPPPSSQSKPRVATFNDISKEEEEEDEDGQEYFAGGEKSGIAMKGPATSKPKATDLVNQLLEKAGKSSQPPPPVVDKKPTYFAGSGNRLGSDESGSTQNSITMPTSGSSQPEHVTTDEEVAERHLTFWKNGFSIDDGELRAYDLPENQAFLKDLNDGRAPVGPLGLKPGQQVEIKVSHKIEEMYTPPPKKLTPFSGSGQRLGAPSSSSSSSSSSMPGSFPSSSITAPPVDNTPTRPSFQVDFDKPHTQIQIRLSDGTRMVTKINLDHTVGDLRNFVRLSRPGQGQFSLSTAFPVKLLGDDNLTIKEAGLSNSVVVQKSL
ncbi:hypothetical protein HK098_007398 [Nowakowskiella sp. JEL0407]|nr:hypothetical protein HK098_007398 [Nowakowskiella sp. JEL0407]